MLKFWYMELKSNCKTCWNSRNIILTTNCEYTDIIIGAVLWYGLAVIIDIFTYADTKNLV